MDREGESLRRLWCQYELWLTLRRNNGQGGDTLHVMSHGLGLQVKPPSTPHNLTFDKNNVRKKSAGKSNSRFSRDALA
eukprot:994198-Prorocentrum_minimum.AAC.1